MNTQRIGSRRLTSLQARLSQRDLAIIGQVAELRLMSACQIEAIHFPITEHTSDLAAARAARRVLERLSRDRLLVRLDRRIGGVRAGSASYVYVLGHVGQRVLELGGPRKRLREPSITFTDHTLAVSQLVVDLILAERDKALELVECQAEPACWRRYTGNRGMEVLRPDLFVVIASSEYEYRWFVEQDMGTEHLPTLLQKCRAYDDYYRTGIEQRATRVFPRVCWVVPDQRRVSQLMDKIEGSDRLSTAMFVATTPEGAVTVLSGGKR